MNISLKPNKAKTQVFKKILLFFLFFLTGVVLFLVTVFLIFPLHLVEDRVKEGLREQAGIALSDESFQRALPFGFEARKIELFDARNNRPLVFLDYLRADIDPLSVFGGDIRVNLTGNIANGSIKGVVLIDRNGAYLNMEGKEIGFESIPALAASGLNLKGAFNGSLSIVKTGGGCPEGNIKLKGNKMGGDEMKFMGLPLPVGDIDDAGASVELKGCKARVSGVWIEGKDISARLQGEVAIATPFSASPINLTLDITPKGALLKKEHILSLISRYRKSANYYSIQIRGTVGSPLAE